jgi:small subunit ribosomal protein S6
LQDCFDAFPGFEGAPRQALLEQRKEGAFMALYEHIYLARQDVSQQQVEELTAALTEVLSQGGGKVTKNEYWGLKGLSYRIRKNRKAHYTLLNIEAPAPAIAEMERQMRINEDILRFMTVRVDELEEGPSAMMQKRDRDDRDGGDRGGRGAPSGDRRPRRF